MKREAAAAERSGAWRAQLARGLAVMLTLSLLGAAMIKAQGCARPTPDTANEQATPVTPNAQDAQGVAGESNAAADAGRAEDAAEDAAPPPLKVFPATKSLVFPVDDEPLNLEPAPDKK